MVLLYEYYAALVHVGVSVVLSSLVAFIAYITPLVGRGAAKGMPYECGFEPFGDSRMRFDVHFYIIGILFIIFDVEIVLMVPWALNAALLGVRPFLANIIFLFLVTFGLAIDWRLGAIGFHRIPV